MTAGQMAPTTLPNQITHTTPYGRDVKATGMPIKMCEMLSTLESAYYIERVSVDSVPNVRHAKKAIAKAFMYQAQNKGFTMIEVLSNCPTNWGVDTLESIDWLRENMMPYYPLGVYKEGAAQ
jgi:2-oxoglutarate ferredoxin oxidoreductase subunit beta